LKLSRIALPSLAAAAGAAALLLPTQTEAFNTLGGSLSMQSQRDVRVFNNFTDSTVTDNMQEHVMFPGYVGVEMAIWKSCIEWGSTLHGDGSGDSTQVNGLGSGGANFDISWQGNASGVGDTNENIHSQLNGNGGGVYAFCETPISDGWRIRYYQSPWTWEDGPGTLPGGRVDIQGISTHEYGHALGLDHSGVGGSTMFAGTSEAGSINLRSLHADDSAGVQFIYGVAAGNKPTITDVQTIGSTVAITGSNFDANNNEVWFTQDGVGGSGTPVKAFGVGSTGLGTAISVLVPAGAGSGDILVRRPGTGGDDLSNAWPFDVTGGAQFDTFCDGSDNAIFWCPCGNSGDSDTGCDNSGGTGGVGMEVSFFDPNGPSAVVTCTGYPLASSPTAIIIRSPAKVVGTPPIFGDGVRCVSATNLVRLAATTASAGASVHGFGHGAMAGSGDFHYQAWYRNTPASYCTPDAFNLSSGVTLTWP
jgi:hypothetical protein